jgi:hypothetical protein
MRNITITLKREYFDPNWEAKGLQPFHCKRYYVQYLEGNCNPYQSREAGPFDNRDEAQEFINKNRQKIDV